MARERRVGVQRSLAMIHADDTPRAERPARFFAAPHIACFAAQLVLQVALWTLVLAPPRAAAFAPAWACWLVGVTTWTLVEYALHRIVFHLPRSHLLSRLGARAHLDHHDAPGTVPITKPVALTCPIFVLAGVYACLMGSEALAGLAGLVAGYFVYEVVHVAAHTVPRHRHPLPRLQRHHLAHHRDSTRAFGITSTFWDAVLRTSPRETLDSTEPTPRDQSRRERALRHTPRVR